MLDIEHLSKDEVYAVMREILYSINYLYIRLEDLLKRKYPDDFRSEEISSLYEQVGAYEAKRVSAALGTLEPGVDALIKLLRHSHWAVFENIDIEKVDNRSFRMRTIDCSAQRAARKSGLDYYDCQEVALVSRNGFLRAVNPQVTVRRIFSPPETPPAGVRDDASCEWFVSL